MRTSFFAMLTVLTLCAAASAAPAASSVSHPGGVGLGVVLGDTVGASAKAWLDRTSALDVGLGSDSGHGNFTVYGDFLYHGWKAFPQPPQGELAAYLGGGPRIESRSDRTEFGLRAVLGASYWLKASPLELFAELGPFFRMTPNGGVYVVGGVGARYYFHGWN